MWSHWLILLGILALLDKPGFHLSLVFDIKHTAFHPLPPYNILEENSSFIGVILDQLK